MSQSSHASGQAVYLLSWSSAPCYLVSHHLRIQCWPWFICYGSPTPFCWNSWQNTELHWAPSQCRTETLGIELKGMKMKMPDNTKTSVRSWRSSGAFKKPKNDGTMSPMIITLDFDEWAPHWMAVRTHLMSWLCAVCPKQVGLPTTKQKCKSRHIWHQHSKIVHRNSDVHHYSSTTSIQNVCHFRIGLLPGLFHSNQQHPNLSSFAKLVELSDPANSKDSWQICMPA